MLFHPSPPPFRALKRRVPLDASDDRTYVAWINADTPQTFSEFCESEWTNRPERLPPPPHGVSTGQLRASSPAIFPPGVTVWIGSNPAWERK